MRPLLPILALLVATSAHASPLAGAIGGMERRSTLLRAHRGRLEKLLDGQAKRIARLKRQRSNVGRDLQLKRALRTSQQLASRLTRLRNQLRTLHQQLLTAYDRALSSAKTAAERARWHARRRRLLERRRAASRTRIVTSGKASPLDGVDDLEAKADLLKDSEEKVRRQLRRVERRFKALARRAKLRRHGRAADDGPFVEDSPRRLAGKRQRSATPKSGAEDRNNYDGDPQSPPAPAPGAGLHGDAVAPSEAGGGAVGPRSSTTLRPALDPSTLRALAQAGKKGTLKQRLAALKKARARLAQLAATLAKRAKKLQGKARKLRKRQRKGRRSRRAERR